MVNIFTGRKDVNQTVPNGNYIFFSCSPETFRSDDYICDDKAIIIVGNGSYTGTVRFYEGKFDLYQRTYACTLKDNVKFNFDIKFLFYYIKKYFEHKFMGGTRGSSIPYIVRSDIENFQVPYPPLREQKAIAAVLSSFDDKIELLRRQNKTLEAIAQAIFKEWFVKFKYPGANEKMINSELGQIPDKWKVGTVNDVIERFSITYRCDQSDISPEGKTPILDQGTNGLYGYTEREPDFLASMENPVVIFANHTCNMWFINYPFCAIQNVIPFRGNSEYSTFYVFYMTLGRVKFIEYKGHWPDFEQKKYVIPTPEIANNFAETVKPLQYKMWNNNFQIQTLSRLRDTLLPKLMKGEIRVKL